MREKGEAVKKGFMEGDFEVWEDGTETKREGKEAGGEEGEAARLQ